MMIATCGHEITNEWFDRHKGEIAIKNVDRYGETCIDYMIVCPECLKEYEKSGLIIERGDI